MSLLCTFGSCYSTNHVNWRQHWPKPWKIRQPHPFLINCWIPWLRRYHTINCYMNGWWWQCILLYANQATRYANQHIWCLSQAKINWEGCARNGIWCKNDMDGRVGAPTSLDWVAVHPDCWWVCRCYLHLHQKIQKLANKDTTFGYHYVDASVSIV